MKLHKPTFSVSSIKKPRINKTAILVSLAVLLVLAVFAYGAVRAEQAKKSQEQAQAAQAAAEKAQKDATDKAFKQVQSELNVQTARAVTACSVLKQYAATKTTARLVAVPPVCL
jgi:hypothetical protein